MNINQAIPFGRYFEDFSEGAFYEHAICKTITESDNNLFCLITMNHHPAHINHEYAQQSQHGRVLVVGTLVFSLVVGLTVADISGHAIANLEYESVNHMAPVYIGDTINAQTKIIEIRHSNSRGDRGVIYVETSAYNQKKELVLIFRRRFLVKKQNT
jgi:acyl dehydratase